MFRILFALATLGLILGLVSGFLGAFHPAFDTLAHFRWHFALCLLGLSILGLVLKIRRAPLILLLFAILGVWQSNAGNRINANPSKDDLQNPVYSLLHYNLRFDNAYKSEVLAFIRKTDADIISLSETSRQWEGSLATLVDLYPHQFHCPEWNTIGGGMILSKYPMRAERDYCHAYAAAGFTEINVDGSWIETGTTHMRWPWPASGPEQLEALKPRLEQIGTDALIAGDFNAATWSLAMLRFAKYSSATIHSGFGGTWMPRQLPSSLAPWFGLPIDGVLSKGSVHIIDARTLPSIGSDHLPLLVEFAISN